MFVSEEIIAVYFTVFPTSSSIKVDTDDLFLSDSLTIEESYLAPHPQSMDFSD